MFDSRTLFSLAYYSFAPFEYRKRHINTHLSNEENTS